jgi:hypothetical protein
VHSWDATGALGLAEALSNRGPDFISWIPARDVFDGAVAAALRLDRARDARAWLNRSDLVLSRADRPIWRAILDGLIAEAEP